MEKKAIHQYIGYRGNSNILQILCVLLLLAVNGVLCMFFSFHSNPNDPDIFNLLTVFMRQYI